ncbi:MAG: arginine--tRNA ligase, partial [Phycisphaerales bacterium]|nr:arginine--tRNA ligase [Phycisphaerales bacterium]
CNAAMSLGKRLGVNPREAAARMIEHIDLGGLAEPFTPGSIAGPGFINITLKPDAIADLLSNLDTPDLGLRAPESPETVVVDLCGVNLAKQMHVGHLRSTVIGDTVARLFERLGHTVIRQNHVGDWGLPIAMVTAKLKAESDAGRIDLDAVTLDQLNRLYREAQLECSADRKGLAAVRRFDLGPKAEAELEEQVASAEDSLANAKSTLIRLQSHDPEIEVIWRRIERTTMTVCLDVCRRLHTRIGERDSAGESSYATELAGLVEDLESRGVAEPSEGALVVRVEGVAEPCLIRKGDGGFLYATTDLAAIRRRVQRFGASRVIYCVDARQSFHFRLVFAAAREAGYTGLPGGAHADLEHAAFGTVLGEDNKPLKTRSGENVKLEHLVDESVARARAALADRQTELDDPDAVAEAVGITAIKYADLSTERSKDYVFSFDRMVSFEGNTGPYLLYARARLNRIFDKAADKGVDAASSSSSPFSIAEPEERALALLLLRYPATIRGAAASLEPHRVCSYMYDLAVAFSRFYDKCHVLNADDDVTRLARLRLCGLTRRVLSDGLETLGLPVVDRM